MLIKVAGRSCLCKYNTISGTNTCVYSHLDCIEDSLPEGDMAALFVHVVEVFMQREKVLYTALGCWPGGSCFCTDVQYEDQRKGHLVSLVLFSVGT